MLSLNSRSDARRRVRVLALAALGCAIIVTTAPRGVLAESQPAEEIRALWVLRTSLTSPASIEQLVRAARANGFNTLLVQVRGRGDAFFAGGIEPRATELQRQPADFDPLASVLAAGHAAGLQVHAWVNVNLVASAAELPSAREHIVHRHPEWLMVPRDLAQELALVDPESPAYVGKLARWTRTQASQVEGLYASPLVPAAADHLGAVVRDLARRYHIDGVHFDYARYPNDRFDYSRTALREFRTHVRSRVSAAERQELDARETDDLFAWADARPDEWRAFRIAKMTALVSRLRTAVKAERPHALVSVAVAPDVREAYEGRLQDWRTWLENGFVDVICPMAYTSEAARFAEQIATAADIAGGGSIWAGIGAYRLSPAETVDNIHTARRLGARGIVLFSYDAMISSPPAAADYLALVNRGAFAEIRSSSGAGSR
jgi:uncharacterized lipoprotein YddW (UPF0748 family)